MSETHSTKRNHNFIDLTGQAFGRWTVIRNVPAPAGKPKRAYWLCRCECGTESIVVGKELRNGSNRGCWGCHGRKHGMTQSPEYGVWASMRSRCTSPTAVEYPRYGERGIKVCEQWKSFEAFYEDMGPRPSAEHSIERIDNDGNYEPGNCCWATPGQQSRNTRRNHRITFRGKTQCMSDWSKECGIPLSVLCSRVNRGWDIERAITTPVTYRASRLSHAAITHDGITCSLCEWSNRLNIGYYTLLHRMRNGWPIDRVLTEPVHSHAPR